MPVPDDKRQLQQHCALFAHLTRIETSNIRQVSGTKGYCMDALTRRISIASLMVVIAAALAGCPSETEEPVSNGDTAGTSPPPPPASNNAPVISGTPGTLALVSDAYSFTPNASDPDDDPLTFSVQNKPVWAEFSSSTGALTGMPSIGDVGSYTNIGISVSDGDLSNSLPQFSVDVIQNADGSITLSWTAPTENEDGTALTDLAAYKLYYGTSSGSYPNQIRVDNPGITTFVIENLVPTTYYIVATAINDAGVESRFSNEAIKQVL